MWIREELRDERREARDEGKESRVEETIAVLMDQGSMQRRSFLVSGLSPLGFN